MAHLLAAVDALPRDQVYLLMRILCSGCQKSTSPLTAVEVPWPIRFPTWRAGVCVNEDAMKPLGDLDVLPCFLCLLSAT